MDPFELLSQPTNQRVSPEVLEMLGHKASQLYQQQGIPLNQAIVQVASSHPELSNEHLKRVIEFANTVTFQELFQNSEDKNVHFDIADPGVVLRDLKDGGTPAHDGKPLSKGLQDYNSSPKSQEAGFPEADQLFSNQFTSGLNGGTVDMPKVASISHFERANPIDEVYDNYINITSKRDQLISDYEGVDMLLKQAKSELYDSVKSEVISEEGAGLSGVISAMQKVASDEDIHSLLSPMVESLVQEWIPESTLRVSMEKKAGAVVNPNHPIVIKTAAVMELANHMVYISNAIDSMQKMASASFDIIKEAGNIATGVKKAIGVRGKVPAGLRQRNRK